MGAIEDFSRAVCQDCHLEDPSVAERGRAYPMGVVLCDPCWNVVANELALEEGATATPWPDPGPDEFGWCEPKPCPRCRAHVANYPTNYDRWVCLSTTEAPAEDVPPQDRWRLQTVPARHSSVPVRVVAVRLRAVDPLPGELVRPAHRSTCLDPDAVRENIFRTGGSWSA